MTERRDLTWRDIQQHLQAQGLDATLSEMLAEVLWKHVLTWEIPNGAKPAAAKYIFAFAFGFRWSHSQYGAREPGPVNQALADQVIRYYREKARDVFAQWEIGSQLQGTVNAQHLHPIYPEVVETGSGEQYLSTKGVLDKIVNLLKGELQPKEPKSMGPVLIVAHRNHLPRCVWLANEMGFTVAAEQARMPVDYDRESTQRWITSPERGIVSEIISRLAAYKEKLYREQP